MAGSFWRAAFSSCSAPPSPPPYGCLLFPAHVALSSFALLVLWTLAFRMLPTSSVGAACRLGAAFLSCRILRIPRLLLAQCLGVSGPSLLVAMPPVWPSQPYTAAPLRSSYRGKASSAGFFSCAAGFGLLPVLSPFADHGGALRLEVTPARPVAWTATPAADFTTLGRRYFSSTWSGSTRTPSMLVARCGRLVYVGAFLSCLGFSFMPMAFMKVGLSSARGQFPRREEDLCEVLPLGRPGNLCSLVDQGRNLTLSLAPLSSRLMNASMGIACTAGCFFLLGRGSFGSRLSPFTVSFLAFLPNSFSSRPRILAGTLSGSQLISVPLGVVYVSFGVPETTPAVVSLLLQWITKVFSGLPLVS